MKIFVDPGHGLGSRSPGVWDPGAVAGGVSEADVVFAWALTLKHVLAERGIQSVLSRKTDRDEAPLRYRVKAATDLGCSHLLSLHCNAGAILARGTETFHRYDTPFVRAAHHAAVSAVGSADRGVRPEHMTQHKSLAILAFRGPACLIELGFLTNPGDRRRLLDRGRRIAFATAIAGVLA